MNETRWGKRSPALPVALKLYTSWGITHLGELEPAAKGTSLKHASLDYHVTDLQNARTVYPTFCRWPGRLLASSFLASLELRELQ